MVILFLASETLLNLPLNNLQWLSLVSVGKEEHSGRAEVGLVSPWAVTLSSTSFVVSAEFSAAHGKQISVSESVVAH